MKKTIVLLLLSIFFCSGCGAENTVVENIATDSTVTDETRKITADDIYDLISNLTEETAVSEETQVVEEGMELFAELPDEFYFSSGAGGWGTELFLEDDGTFYGQYHDSDMGSIGEEYPNGIVYICNFEGKFSTPQQVNEYAYSAAIEYMNIDREGEEYIEEGIKYIVCEPYGLDNAGEILFYLYGTPQAELPEEFLSWMVMGYDMGPESLNCYGIYNVNEGTAFSGYIYEEYTELCKLDGQYVNEAGDVVIIHLESEIEEYTRELGYVEWIPHDGEAEHGTIMKNMIGGFTIYLDESISYNFEMTNYEIGKIEFSGADEWSEKFGTFIMQ